MSSHRITSVSKQKEAGVYYTPQLLADYIVYRLFDEGNFRFDSSINVLEPSVGGGIFLNGLFNGNHYKDKGLFNKSIPKLNVDAVEIDPEVASQTKKLAKTYGYKDGRISVVNEDYLTYFLSNSKKYDLIIGNPPYVRRRNMTLEQRELCAEVHKRTGLADVNPKNLWTSFFAGAKESLKPDGVIAFILPADLLQVKYSQEIRELLHKDFSRVEIFTLNWIYFDDIEQDVVILICTNQNKSNKGVSFYHINNLAELEEPKKTSDNDNSQRESLNKWTNYVLDKDEFKLLDDIHKRINPGRVRDYCDSGAGIVTAANDFYIVSKAVVEEYSLDNIVKPTVKKSSSMPPAVILRPKDLEKKSSEGAELHFLDFPDKPKTDLPRNYIRYLQKGEDAGINQRYKMQLRHNWYAVPSVWSSEAFFTKRSNIFPRIVVNNANAYVTDAFYRIRMKDGYSAKNLSYSFANSLTYIYSELMGRYYGGGVLELTPNEFKDLPVPYISKNLNSDFKRLDAMIRGGAKYSEILDFTDKVILHDNFGISNKQIHGLRIIYQKLLTRRLKKSLDT